MKIVLIASAGFLLLSRMAAADESPRLCEPWDNAYAGEDVTGKHVIGLWTFDSDQEGKDASGKGHDAKLNGAKTTQEGRFGSCLESFAGWPVEDKCHAAVVKNKPSLSPQGAFTIEMWIKPKPEFADYDAVFLIDKKYVSDDDYQIILSGPNKRGSRFFRACLGFGAASENFYSESGVFEPGKWYHIAFTYDGAGTGAFYLDGKPFGSKTHSARRAISPGSKNLSIGDRLGSYFHGFPGFIDQVRICNGVLEFGRVRMKLLSERTSFLRMEKSRTWDFSAVNLQRSALKGASVSISVGGLAARTFDLPELEPGKSHAVSYPLDTSLRPGTYQVEAALRLPGEEAADIQQAFDMTIVPRRLPHRFPVLMWGGYSPTGTTREADRLKRIGFSHVLGLSADYGRILKAGEPTEPHSPEQVAATKRMLNETLVNGISISATLSPGRYMRSKKEYLRIDRGGKPYEREDICCLFPEIEVFCRNVGASVARAYGDFPAFDAALIHTEVRDSAQVCFHEHDFEAFRKRCGIEIPPEVTTKRGVVYWELEGFPLDRVIPDDHPIYRYCRWFWKEGDGWCALNTAVHEGLKSTGRNDLWTFNDPAVRVASVYGSGGGVGFLSQWTYSYPDPIRIAIATDELLAMAKGAGREQQVMKMTQIIWYRTQTAPKSESGTVDMSIQAPWEDADPEAAFITIAPMHLREAFWTKISRPIKGIMYHGWQSLVPCDGHASYRFTHPQTQHELARLVREVVKPLGPTLIQVPDAQADVAVLESFASQMFAKRGTYGWGGSWLGDVYHVLHYASLQPEIIYDETVVAGSLDGCRVLVMVDCDVITKTMYEKIRAFQESGGLIVGDERLVPAIQPDIMLESCARKGKAHENKAALLALAARLRKELDPHYDRYVDSSNPEVIPRVRRYGTTDYVFAVNDHREYGDYVGHHGLVMENGLPSEAVLTVRRDGGYVYDLVANRPVQARTSSGRLSIDLQLGPCDGKLLMIAERRLANVLVRSPEGAKRGDSVECSISVVDDAGSPLDAVVPVEVEIRDSEGRLAEFSGYYGAAKGQLTIRLDIAENDPRGTWQIRVRELASGMTRERYLRVE